MKTQTTRLLTFASLFSALNTLATIQYTTDFENFDLGSGTPLISDPALTTNNWTGDGVPGYDAEIVSIGGSQGKVLRMSNSVTSPSQSGTHPTTPTVDPVGESGSGGNVRTLHFGFDFASVLPTHQTDLTIDVSPLSGVSRQGILRIYDFADGLAITWIDWFNGGFAESFLAIELARNTWHSVEVDLNLIDGANNDTAVFTINGTELPFVLGSWEGFYSESLFTSPASVDSVAFRAANPTGGVSGNDGAGFYFDNVSVQAIPEASIIGLLGFTGCLILLRRRR